MANPFPSPETLAKSRGWLIAGGILSLIVGFLAMAAPLLFSVVITQLIGAFALANGVISLGITLFGKHTAHRVLHAVSALIRIGVGIALLFYVEQSLAIVTLIIAVVFIVEGISFLFAAFPMKEHKGWLWLALNGIVTIALGLMLYVHWPADAAWALGLLYGINSIFWGTSLLMLGLGVTRPPASK